MASKDFDMKVFMGPFRGATFGQLNLEQLYAHLNEADGQDVGRAYMRSLRVVIRVRKLQAAQEEGPLTAFPYDIPGTPARKGTPCNDPLISDDLIYWMVWKPRLRPEQRRAFLEEYLRRRVAIADLEPHGIVTPILPPATPTPVTTPDYGSPAFEMSQMYEPDDPENPENHSEDE